MKPFIKLSVQSSIPVHKTGEFFQNKKWGFYVVKKLGSWLFAFVLLLAFAVPNSNVQAASNDSMKLVVDGVEVAGYEQPFLSHGEVLIPVENLFKEAGYSVSKDKGVVTATNSQLTVDFNASAGKILVDGKKADTVFPLTLNNGGNYISDSFLSTLEGFEVSVSDDKKSVQVTTNRVKDVEGFLEKMLDVDLNSYSATMKIDQKMKTSNPEEEEIDMIMDMKMDVIEDPLALYTSTKMQMNMDGENLDQTSEAYLTKEGFFQYDSMVDKWIKMDDELTDSLFDSSVQQMDPLAQLELTKKFIDGIHIYEYEDQYVMTQTITNEQFREILDEVMALLPGLLPDETTESVIQKVEGVPVDVEATDAEDVEIEEDATEEDVTDEEITDDLESILDALDINIEEFLVVSTIDKKTLFPLEMSGVTKMTMGIEDETISITQLISGAYSNHNNVEEIKIPADVIKNAITMEEYLKELGLDEEEAEPELEA